MKGDIIMKNKKILLTAATVAILSLAACNTYADRAGQIDGYRHRTGHIDGYRHQRADRIDGYNNRVGRTDRNRTNRLDGNRANNNNGYNSRVGRTDRNRTNRLDGNRTNNNNRYDNRVDYYDDGTSYGNNPDYNSGNHTGNRIGTRTGNDTHLNFVSNYGFQNVTNANGTSAYRKYRLDSNNAGNDDVFHSWRHTWVEPRDYVGKDIDLYRYTGTYNGENRTIHILSHNGKPIGGYHYGRGETSENGVMFDRDGFSSRGANDFRGDWDGMFNTRG